LYTAKALFFNYSSMETKDMLEKILRREELSPADQVEILRLVRAEHIDEAWITTLLKRDFLSVEQKIELLGKLVSQRAQKILLEEYLIASLGVNEKVDVTLRGESYEWAENVAKFLRILGAQDVETIAHRQSDGDYYIPVTKVKFRV
jgi:hypothetical protein